MKALILSWLMSLPWTAADRSSETVEARHARMTTIAESVADAAKGDRLKAAFVLVHFRHETNFDEAVQRCDCKRWQCDAIVTPEGVYHRAHSLAQAHEVGFKDLAGWWQTCGTERVNVDANVRFTLRYFTPPNLSCGYAWLGGGHLSCRSYPDTHPRAVEARRLAGRL